VPVVVLEVGVGIRRSIWLRGNCTDYLTARNRRINAFTLEDAKRVAGEVLKVDRLMVTIVGMPKLSG
jgi:predicted Zn-dependent peptidase